jgi:hypothetical protein
MIRSPKEYAHALGLSGRALESLTDIVRLYATHKDSRCVDESAKCECGLSTFKIIGESRLAELRDALKEIEK